jgi:hypothetical protein
LSSGENDGITIEESGLQFKRLEQQIAAEAVPSCNALAEMAHAFRSMKTIDLRPHPLRIEKDPMRGIGTQLNWLPHQACSNLVRSAMEE